MIVDASAIAAILLREPEAVEFGTRIEQAPHVATHAVSVFEAAAAVARASRRSLSQAQDDVAAFLADSDMEVVEIGTAEAAAAISAASHYGKGRHPARLNMGDCFSYACAKLRGLPLLYKGDGLAQTDLA